MRLTIFCTKSRSASSSMSLQRVAAQHAGALADEVLELGAAQLMVEAGLHHADELADATSGARRSRSWVMMTPVNPATRVPSRSKKAPTSGPAGLASISATEPGSRMVRRLG